MSHQVVADDLRHHHQQAGPHEEHRAGVQLVGQEDHQDEDGVHFHGEPVGVLSLLVPFLVDEDQYFHL